jgi:hypothetical protein
MNWTRPIEEIVEAIIVMWLFSLFFGPRKGDETRRPV